MNRRALCVGINNFADGDIPPLKGCVNDARNVAQVLVREFGFDPAEVRVLVNQQATKSAYLQGLSWLAEGAQAGDLRVLFTSSHGSHVPDDNSDESDDEDEVLVVYDHDWERCMLRDDELAAGLARMPRGVQFAVVFDTCHSGTMEDTQAGSYETRDMPRPGRMSRRAKAALGLSEGVEMVGSRYLEPPRRMAKSRGVGTRAAIGAPSRSRGRARPDGGAVVVEGNLPAVGFSACNDDETAADAKFGGVHEGAFTHCLLETLHRADGELTWEALHRQTQARVKELGFEQTPQLHVPAAMRDRPAFGGRRARSAEAPRVSGNVTALDARIVAAENAGQWPAAAQLLQQRVSVVADPQEKVRTLEHLVALCRVKLGDEAAAVRATEQLVSIAPSHEGALGYLREHYARTRDAAKLQALQAHQARAVEASSSRGILGGAGASLQGAMASAGAAVSTAAAGVFQAVTAAPVAYETPAAAPAAAPRAATSSKCPYCRADNPVGARVCGACGASY